MPKGFRPTLEPPTSRKVEVETRRPWLCLVVTLGVIILIFAIFGVSAWNVYEHRFHRNEYNFHIGDEVSLIEVTNDLSSTFCEAYEVSLWASGDIYLLPGHAKVNKKVSQKTPVELHQLPYRAYNVQSMYLLEQSYIEATACRQNGSMTSSAEIVFIHGSGNFRKWREDSQCNDCGIERVTIPDNATCDNVITRDLAKLEHTVAKNGKYYLAIFYGRPGMRRHVNEPGIYLNGSIGRTHFNISDAEENCKVKRDSSCTFLLPWNSDKDIVVKFGDFRGMTKMRDVLHTQCQVRLVFWICLFGAVPVLLVIPASILFGCLLCRRKARNLSRVTTRLSHGVSKRGRETDSLLRKEVVQGEDGGSMTIQDG